MTQKLMSFILLKFSEPILFIQNVGDSNYMPPSHIKANFHGIHIFPQY